MDIAGSGSDAIKAVSENRYEIIFLDHMMPDMDGIETRQNMENAGLLDENTAVIMMTANAIVGAKEEYIAAGFTDYLFKPIEVRSLETILKKYLPAGKVGYKTVNADNNISGSAAPDVPAAASDDTKAEQPVSELPASEKNEEQADTNSREISGNERHINIAAGMEFCMNDTGFYKEMIGTFVSESPVKREQLEAALEKN